MTAPVGKLTEAEAQAMLTRLTEHYGEPVLPISRYCAGLRAWQTALTDKMTRIKTQLFPDLALDFRDEANNERLDAARKEYHRLMLGSPSVVTSWDPGRAHLVRELRDAVSTVDSVRHIFRQISKSNLLARILYNGEKVRTRTCPEHKGRWSGVEWSESRCPHGCQLTGWLPEPKDEGKPLPGVQAVRLMPVGEGKATVVRDVDGATLGTVSMVKPEDP